MEYNNNDIDIDVVNCDVVDDSTDIIFDLLKEFKDHRDEIKKMIIDLERLKEKIDILIPEQLDKRYKMFFEEKIKTITFLFNSLLDMRKEIAKSLKDEIEVRRKINKKELDIEDLESIVDIREIVSKVETLSKESVVDNIEKIKNKSKKKVSLMNEMVLKSI